MVLVKVFIFDGNGGVFDILGDVLEVYGSTSVIGVDLVEKILVTIENFGTLRGWGFGEFGWTGNIFKKEEKPDKKNTSHEK